MRCDAMGWDGMGCDILFVTCDHSVMCMLYICLHPLVSDVSPLLHRSLVIHQLQRSCVGDHHAGRSNKHIARACNDMLPMSRMHVHDASLCTPQFERRPPRSGSSSPTYHIVGYTTLYKFLLYPSSWRLRISQIMILPPYQRVGHGQQLLQWVYGEAERREFAEVRGRRC